MISSPTILATQSVLEEILTKEQMLVIHRLHMEMTRSNPVDVPGFVHNNTPTMMCDEIVTGNEIIVVEDDEDTYMDISNDNPEASNVLPNTPTDNAPGITECLAG